MDGIKEYIKDRVEYRTTIEKGWTRDFIEDLEMIVVMLEKAAKKKEKQD